MSRSVFACCLALFCLDPGAFGQAAKDQQQPPAAPQAPAPQSTDSEYRKFDEMLTFLRNRNAKQYAISSPKGIDESKHFTVVQWDERGAGRTLRKNGSRIAPTVTLDRMVQDGIELAEYRRKHLHNERIILVGHSFGSILGVKIARAKPELLYAYTALWDSHSWSRIFCAGYQRFR